MDKFEKSYVLEQFENNEAIMDYIWLDRPIISLVPLPNQYIPVEPGSIQESLTTVLRVLELGGKKWNGGQLPTEYESMYFQPAGLSVQDGLYVTYIEYFHAHGYKPLTEDNFYTLHNITPKKINAVNNWFDTHKSLSNS